MAIALLVAAMACNPNMSSQSDPSAGGSDQCEPVETHPIQGGQHLLGDAEPPVPYSTTPPTSGWHSSGQITIGVAEDEPLSEPQQVSVLEAGGVVVTYNDISAQDLAQLVSLARGSYSGRVSVTSYDKLAEGQVALTGWGVMQVCDGLDVEVTTDFMESFSDPQPAVPGADV